MTYNVFGGTLNLTQSINQPCKALNVSAWLNLMSEFIVVILLVAKVRRIVKRKWLSLWGMQCLLSIYITVNL